MHAISEDTMNDRELLELAAKAAGHAIDRIDAMHDPEDWACWNPLEDDGDALRLAELCSLTVCMNGTGTVSACDDYNKAEVFATQSIHDCGGSRIAATRRAIVRAAAEIGRSMP